MAAGVVAVITAEAEGVTGMVTAAMVDGTADGMVVGLADMVDRTAAVRGAAAADKAGTGANPNKRCLPAGAINASELPGSPGSKWPGQNKNGVVIAHNAVCKTIYCLNSLGWLMGLEPTTTGITILDSTN
jgi:hypothetical protein